MDSIDLVKFEDYYFHTTDALLCRDAYNVFIILPFLSDDTAGRGDCRSNDRAARGHRAITAGRSVGGARGRARRPVVGGGCDTGVQRHPGLGAARGRGAEGRERVPRRLRPCPGLRPSQGHRRGSLGEVGEVSIVRAKMKVP